MELVHVQVLEAPPLGVGKPAVGSQVVSALVQQVVKVDHVPVDLFLLVVLVDPRHRRRG